MAQQRCDGEAPHALLRFVRHEGYVYYMTEEQYDSLCVTRMNLEFPVVQIQGLTLGLNGLLVGYRFRVPASAKVHPTHVVIGRSNSNWEPSIALPGIQVFTSESGAVICSTQITKYLEEIL